MKLALLTVCFWITAALYASIGFGGGSTYTALLVLFNADYRLIPLIALSCNILVVCGNALRYHKEKLIPWPRLWPLLITSIPAAWLGGRINISETLFIGLLWAALLIAGLKLWRNDRQIDNDVSTKNPPVLLSGFIGGAIGFYAGLVGIGGGIFLAPILYILNWGRAKTIAAACSIFILLNSIAGLAGQYSKLSGSDILEQAFSFWPFIPAILIGGYIGNYIGIYRLSDQALKRATAVLIIFVALRLMVKWIGLIS